jgi:alpha-galactosidase
MIRQEHDLFFLDAGESQAVIGLFRGRWPVLYHWGTPLRGGNLDRIPAAPNGYSVFGDNDDKTWTPNRLPLEYPGPEVGDFRSPAFLARDNKGRPVVDLRVTGWTISDGRPDLGPLPHARLADGAPDVQTLTIEVVDPVTGLAADLRWTPIGGVIVRSVKWKNQGSEPVTLDRAFSFNVDLHPDRDRDLLALDGAWARERHLRRFDLPAGRWEASSRRGVSSHQAWPGVVLADRGTTEASGEAWGMTLVWSGDWTLGAERDEDGGWRLQGGLHPEFFRKTLAPGESFVTPEAVLVHSARGLSGFSATSHAFVVDHILPPAWARRERPILANNWEATYFAFTQGKLLALADEARDCGIEVFVLDDGWFGHRDDDRSSLGDWTPHPGKFPRGLAPFAAELKARGLGFGLWFEPEMVSPDSTLYRNHPDWCLGLEGHSPAESRNQLVLDLTRPEVRKHIVDSVAAILSEVSVTYVKWDMNRPLSHAGADRFAWTLGLYEVLGTLTTRFPEVLFEGCAGGGGRMDLGLLFHVPQYWTSDNTDALDRLAIQEGTSLFLPPVVMGSHVSAVPNHQTGRITSLSARTRVAFAGNLGYELDFTKVTGEEKATIRADVAWYKAHRKLIQTGVFRRTRTSLEDTNTVAWQIHAGDRSEVLLWWFRPRARANERFPVYRWSDLDPESFYELIRYPSPTVEGTYRGDELMGRGVPVALDPGEGAGAILHLKQRS